jgi:hypothetical protein
VGLMTIFCSFRFETPSTWRTKSRYLYPPGKGEVIAIYSLGTDCIEDIAPSNLLYYCARILCCGYVFIEPLPSNGCHLQLSCHNTKRNLPQLVKFLTCSGGSCFEYGSKHYYEISRDFSQYKCRHSTQN